MGNQCSRGVPTAAASSSTDSDDCSTSETALLSQLSALQLQLVDTSAKLASVEASIKLLLATKSEANASASLTHETTASVQETHAQEKTLRSCLKTKLSDGAHVMAADEQGKPEGQTGVQEIDDESEEVRASMDDNVLDVDSFESRLSMAASRTAQQCCYDLSTGLRANADGTSPDAHRTGH